MKTQSSMLLAMSVPPYWHSGQTTQKRNLHILAALVPVVLMAAYNWGLPAVRVMAVCVGTSILAEALCQKAMKRDIEVDDFSAALSGLLLAFLLPAAAPLWLAALGCIVAVTLGKMLFGGLGANPVNTTIVGYLVLAVSFPLLTDPNFVQLGTDYLDPLARLKYLGAQAADTVSWQDLALGRQIGGLGASQAGALFLAGSYLAARGLIRWQIALGFFLGIASLATAYVLADPAQNVPPFFHILTGATLLGGFFLATDTANAPAWPLPMFLFGFLAGALVFILRKYSVHVDGVAYAILLMNLATPYLDMLRPKPFGAR